MIIGFLVERMIKKLKTEKNWDSIQVGATPEGKPHPHCPDFFVSIIGSSTSNVFSSMPQDCHVMEFGFTVRITVRTKLIPVDRLDLLYFENTLSLLRISTEVLKILMDSRETIRSEVNTDLSDASEQYNVWMGMTRSYKWVSTDTQPIERDNSWFSSREPTQDSFNTAGYTIDMNFGEAHGTFRSLE
jgi:hypothetical protein